MSRAQETFFLELLLLSNSRLEYYSLCQGLSREVAKTSQAKNQNRVLWRRDSGLVAHNLTHPTPLHTFRIFLSSFHDQCVLITVLEPRERDTSYNGQNGEAPPERGTFFWLQVYERVGISLVELYERIAKFVLFSL